MESLELGDATAGGAAKPCITRHRCHTCERTRSVRVRVLSWILGKFSLLLIIVVTSATTTFLYHKLLPDDLKHSPASSTAEDPSDVRDRGDKDSKEEQRLLQTEQSSTRTSNGIMSTQPSSFTSARLGLRSLVHGAHLNMTKDDPQFFTSGHVVLEEGVLLVTRATTLFVSADVILKSMNSPGDSQGGPSTVEVCLSLLRGANSKQTPIACRLTYLRPRDQQLARVWMLFPAQANDRICVSSSWPSYVLNNSNNKQQSVFTAFEVGHG